MAHARVFLLAAVIAASALAPCGVRCAPQCPEAGSGDAAQNAACAAPPSVAAGDSIYKCTGTDGAEVLQNAPCTSDAASRAQVGPAGGGADTDGAIAGAPRAAPAPEAADSARAATPPNGFTGEPASASPPPGFAGAPGSAEASSDDPASLPSEPALGMTPGQVQAILGPPVAVTQEEVVQGRVVTWIYGDSRTLQFDASGRLSSK